MTGNPEKIIEQYLDRVRVYLPLDSEDTLTEIRTHILEEAEAIGQGQVTAGSVMMAIERMGEPGRVANEYAGTNEKTGPIPTAYVEPLIRIIAVFIGVGAAFLVGAVIVGQAFSNYGLISFIPWFAPFLLVINIIFAFMIVGGLSMLEEFDPSERTALESVLGLGVDAFKPQPRYEGAANAIAGVIAAVIIMHPAVQAIFSTVFLQFTPFIALLYLISAAKGALYFYGGENNTYLTYEIVVSLVWVFFSMYLINIAWPVQNAWVFVNNEWTLVYLPSFMESFGLVFFPFDLIWAVIVWVTVLSSVWHIIVSVMKITMYTRMGRGIWWTGTWGDRRYKKRNSRFFD